MGYLRNSIKSFPRNFSTAKHVFRIPRKWPSATYIMPSIYLPYTQKRKGPMLCGSYRPVSLLNVDYKIIAKGLARHLERILPSLISPDQTGSIRGRHSSSHTRRLFDIIFTRETVEAPELVLSLDAEKAFDRVEWVFLLETLKKFDCQI